VTRVLALVVAAFGMGYFLSYFLRNVNAVIAPDITAAFALSGTQIGLMTSVYFLMAALVLVPVAISLDRYGPRRVLIVQLFVTAAGCITFALGTSFAALLCGRGLIGLGVAGCLTTAFKAVTVWFPRDKWATGNSLVLGVGSLGVIAGTQPLQWVLHYVTWRDVFWLCALVSLVVVAIVVLRVPERNAPATDAVQAPVYRDVLTMPVFWRLIPVTSVTMAVFFSIQGLWANPWLSDVAGLTQTEVGHRLLLVALSMSAGMLLNGSLADALTGMGVPLAAVMSVGFLGLLCAVAAITLRIAPVAWWPWALLGFTGNIGALGYTLISRRVASNGTARAMSMIAVANFMIAFLIQFSMGWVLDRWGRDDFGAYPAQAYTVALATLLGLMTLTFLWFLSSREIWTSPDFQEVPE
jgi:predicted MFS family arabinose efflux permease